MKLKKKKAAAAAACKFTGSLLKSKRPKAAAPLHHVQNNNIITHMPRIQIHFFLRFKHVLDAEHPDSSLQIASNKTQNLLLI